MGQQVEIRSATATPAIFGEALTMSSREIAELVEVRHDSVKRAIERLAEKGVIVQPPAVDEQDTDTMGRKRTTSVYQLEKRDSFVVVAQLSPEFTARVVDRWQELEEEKANGGFKIPRTMGEALRLAADQAEQIAEMQPKAIAYDRLDTADGNLTLRPASKVLGYPERKLAQWMQANRWAFRQSGKGPLQAHVDKRNTGYLDHKLYNYTDERTGEDKVSATLVVTPKGLARLAKALPAI